MRRILILALALTTACVSLATAQTKPAAPTASPAPDDGEQRIRKALEGRFIVTKMDLPAIETGVEMVFDDANVSFDDANYHKQLREYGVAVKKGSRAKITGVRVTAKGIELDLDGGGSPAREWIVAGVTLTTPAPAPKTDREIELERQLQLETSPDAIANVRREIEYERDRRIHQDERNRQTFDRFSRIRSQYIEENRKTWGSKLIIVVRSRKPSVTMRDMMKSLSQYVEILPRETGGS